MKKRPFEFIGDQEIIQAKIDQEKVKQIYKKIDYHEKMIRKLRKKLDF